MQVRSYVIISGCYELEPTKLNVDAAVVKKK